MITYTFGTVIRIEEFNADDHAKSLSLKTFGVVPERVSVKVSRMILKARTYEDTQPLKPKSLLDELGVKESPEEW